MFQDSSLIKQRHDLFIKKVCETGIVWGLENNEGFATSSSEEFENEQGEAIGLLCFWSDEALANACVKEDWASYRPSQITLNIFIENWCLGMSNDGLLAGTDFDNDLFGYEIDPLDLVLELGAELKATGKTIELAHFQSFDELLSEVQKVVTGE